MRYLDFHKLFSRQGCFDINQVLMVEPRFDRTALSRWVDKGYLLHLRQGVYAFNDWASQPGTDWVAAYKMYHPSYISLYSAMAHYEMIPEHVAHVTCVTTLKTASFQNEIGTFTYRHLKPQLFFGFAGYQVVGGQTAYLASPEKALLDLLYLNPTIRSIDDMTDLRLDEDFMANDFDLSKAQDMLKCFDNKALQHRFSHLIEAYDL